MRILKAPFVSFVCPEGARGVCRIRLHAVKSEIVECGFIQTNLAAVGVQVSAALHLMQTRRHKKVEFDFGTGIPGRSCEKTTADDHM
jgi:hypothetical protein